MKPTDLPRPLKTQPVSPSRSLTLNLGALACIQGANAILPLIVFPLILTRVGADHYSRIAVTESVMLVLLSLTVYSFDVEGISLVAGLNLTTESERISEIFSEILLARLALFALSGIALVIIAPFMSSTTVLLLSGWILFPLSYTLQSTWFFQAIERNIAPAVVILITRFACIFLIKLIIVSPADFYLAPVIISGCYAMGGAVLLGYIISMYRVRVRWVPLAAISRALNRGKEIFLGNVSVVLYRGSNVVILSTFSAGAAVVTYSLAEKAIKVFQAGATPLNQQFFPRVIRALQSMRTPDSDAFRAILRYTIPQMGLLLLGGMILATGLFLFRDLLPARIHTPIVNDTLTLVIIMAGTVFFGVANFMFGTSGLNYLGKRAYFAKAILATGVMNVVVCSLLSNFFAAKGAAFSFLLAEVFLFALVTRAYFRESVATIIVQAD